MYDDQNVSCRDNLLRLLNDTIDGVESEAQPLPDLPQSDDVAETAPAQSGGWGTPSVPTQTGGWGKPAALPQGDPWGQPPSAPAKAAFPEEPPF